jgi:hypothetical protein
MRAANASLGQHQQRSSPAEEGHAIDGVRRGLQMMLLIIGVAVCLLGVLANRYGHDSRDSVPYADARYFAQRLEWETCD